MSDIRMQSIFLDEEFVLEDKSDVDLYYSRSVNRDRINSQNGHGRNKDVPRNRSSKFSASSPKRRSAARSKYPNAGNAEIKKHQDTQNKLKKAYNDQREEDRNPSGKYHKGQAASRIKKESAIMDMIDII